MKLFAAALVALTLASSNPARAQSPSASQLNTPNRTHRILFALSSGEQQDWDMVLANLHNMIVALPPHSAEFELVAFGPGINFLTKNSTAASGIHDLQQQNVHFVACRNAMRGHNLTDADLAPGVTTVPSGLIEVVSRQEQGWSYIKAGR